jgi:hypothetical protein
MADIAAPIHHIKSKIWILIFEIIVYHLTSDVFIKTLQCIQNFSTIVTHMIFYKFEIIISSICKHILVGTKKFF